MLRAGAAAALAAAVLFGIYVCTPAVLGDGADVMAYSSGIFDMDVSRVVLDLTSGAPAYRPSVHPLQKLWIAPVGGALNRILFDGLDRLRAAQLLLAFVMTLNAVGSGLLAFQLTRRSPGSGLLAGVLCGVSFSSLLAATIPESAALSSLATLAPLLLLGARMGRPFSRGETVAWGLVGVLCVGLTVTQVVHFAIALGVRLCLARREASLPGGARGLAARAASAVALALLLTVAGAELQARVYPGTPPFYRELELRQELHYARFDAIRSQPVRHALRLASHFALLDFAAPLPAYSDFLIRDYGADYWSLSVEEAGPERWTPPQRVLAAALLLALGLVAVRGRWRDPRLLAPGLSLASQLALHCVYGREYVLYSPHWHGLLVAVLVAAVWNGLPGRRAWIAAGGALLAAALLANNLAVMQRVYREVAHGLDLSLRDARGAPRAGPPGAARGASRGPAQ